MLSSESMDVSLIAMITSTVSQIGPETAKIVQQTSLRTALVAFHEVLKAAAQKSCIKAISYPRPASPKEKAKVDSKNGTTYSYNA